jgi:hypothetical protein
MVKVKNVLLVTVSFTVPFVGYALLVNRRLERRIPLVTNIDSIPNKLTKHLQVIGKPKINYVEAYYADLPIHKWSKKSTRSRVEDFVRIFWTTTPLTLEWNFFAFLSKLGIEPFEKQLMAPEVKTQPDFTKGKTMLDGMFKVEKGLEVPNTNEILFSYWAPNQRSTLLGGIHGIACDQVDDRTIRVWFITHIAFNRPTDKLVADETSRISKWSAWFGYDPNIIDPNSKDETFSKPFTVLLWLHRLYSRVLLDFASRDMGVRK